MKKQLCIIMVVCFIVIATAGIAGAQFIPPATRTYNLNWHVDFGGPSETNCYNRAVTTIGIGGPHTFTYGKMGQGVWEQQPVTETGCTKMHFQATCYYWSCKSVPNGQECGWWTDTIKGEHSPCENGLLYMGYNNQLTIQFSKRD